MHKATKISLALVASAAAAVGGLAGSAFATGPNLLVNGGFESTAVGSSFTTYGTGADLGGWTVTGGSVDVIGTYWQPAEGLQSLDLSGNEPGTISQTISTVAGVTYHLSFSMAGNPDGNSNDAAVHTMSVTWNSSDVTGSPFTFDSTSATKDAMNWASDGVDVTATGTTSTLAFTATSPGPYGPALDNVSLTQTNTGSVVTNTAPSMGSFTNSKSTAVFHAVVTSSDPACAIGRAVTFQLSGTPAPTPASQTVLTDGTGLASAKFTVGSGSYTVTSSVASTSNCGSGQDTDTYNLTAPKKS